MKFRALACDYDGTLAHDGAITPTTLAALDRFRHSGRRLFVVTGRELPDLKEVCPALDRFEWVIPENDDAFLEACGIAVAVANSLPMLKQRADFVTSAARGDGVAELIDLILADDLAGISRRHVSNSVK